MQGARRIAIDGPAGSGKSTIGEQLARQLGYLYVDTGAMYRAVAWLAAHEGVDVRNGAELGRLARRAEIVISRPQIADGRQYTVTVNGRDVTWDIRSSAVTRAVSPVSSHLEVRTVLIAQQRAMARQGRIVMVGRDIGAEEVMDDIRQRDGVDHDNMQPARDAIVVATDHLSVQQVLDTIYKYVEDSHETGSQSHC